MKYVFVLDQSSTTFSPTGRLFVDQLSQDLTVNVYFNGSWGSLRHLPLPQSAAPTPSTLQKLRPYLSLKDWDLSFVSLNHEDWCLNRPRSELTPDIGLVDLSGWSPEGRRVMALAHKKDPNIHFKTIPHLIWSIPDSWSLEDAATVPLPYAMAYYSLVLKAAVKATESILVHGGHTSMGQAFLAVAIQLELVPYTTVTNTQQKEFIRTRFPQSCDILINIRILESNIYKIYDKQLPMNIMKETKAKGIDIIWHSRFRSGEMAMKDEERSDLSRAQARKLWTELGNLCFCTPLVKVEPLEQLCALFLVIRSQRYSCDKENDRETVTEAAPAIDNWEEVTLDPAISYVDFVSGDDDVAVCCEVTDADIVAKVINNNIQAEDGASGDEEDNSSVVHERSILSATEAMDHIQEFRHFFERMQFFLRNTGFFGVLPDHLFDINPSWCEWLHSLVEKGIDSGVVKPFDRKVFTFFQEDEALR
uniref:Enoyl reductase (ER) domain-containing protein n=1 Tax=Timema shepardi TaxID=629360 RepID=A0A7R9ASH7_TIMSH|nr:unnamed protein product [Timema shepardi]